MYRSLERSTKDTRDGFFLFSAQALFSWPSVDLAWLLRWAYSWLLDYILQVCQSLRDLFFCLGKLHWFLYLLLSYYYDPGMFIFCWSSNFVKKVVLNESMAVKMASLVSYLVYYIVYRVNLNKLSQNFVGATRTTTIDCRESFIDLYLVFPTNFNIVFLPHTNNVILLEPYSGTITEPGLPVQRLRELFHDNYVQISMRNVAYGVCRQLFICLQKFRQITA